MAITTNIMTTTEVRDLTINDTNFDVNLLLDEWIASAQLGTIRPLLGDDFYDALVADVSSYFTLINNYLKYIIAYKTLIIALPFIHIHIFSGGIRVPSNEFGASGSSKERSELARSCEIISETYVKEMKRYLTDNISSYTLYASQITIVKKGGLIF